MKITLASNNHGYALTRTPCKATIALTFEFIGETKGCHAVLESNGNRIYREIINGRATFPLEALGSSISLSVRDMKKPLDRNWECEGYIIQHDTTGVWVYPEGVNLPYELALSRVDIDTLKTELKELKDSVSNILLGHDII